MGLSINFVTQRFTKNFPPPYPPPPNSLRPVVTIKHIQDQGGGEGRGHYGSRSTMGQVSDLYMFHLQTNTWCQIVLTTSTHIYSYTNVIVFCNNCDITLQYCDVTIGDSYSDK